MKIVHVLESLQTGGMERLVSDLAKLQKAAGHDVFVYTISQGGPLEDVLEKERIHCLNFHKKSGFDVSCIMHLASVFQKEKFDVVHTHNSLANIYAAPAAKWAGVRKIVNTRHGSIDPRQKHLWLWKLSVAMVHKMVFVCRKAKDEFDALQIASPALGTVIYNGIDLNNWSDAPSNAREDVHKEFNIPLSTKIIGVICRLDLLKDIPTLVRAYEITARTHPDTKLFIIGHGSQKLAIQELVVDLKLEDRVVFLGERKDIKRLLAGLDIFALPTLAEGLSIALLEAMSLKKPIITTRVGGNPELIIDGQTGRLITAGVPEEMAQCLKEYLDQPASAEQFGVNARKRVEELFDINRMAREYLELYRS